MGHQIKESNEYSAMFVKILKMADNAICARHWQKFEQTSHASTLSRFI